ncbi:dihydropteroate synthase [Simiduia curdlanivorans]|uniref:Dihydropteroate synthase n=1 Tax=Simiduia curdlanivorans TaxID=1492769 RepID=A0ABV8V3X6_9GAMM|nr:dihydropteroate synthase [Simiduia curdlanivorans]MDN3640897.1 dihydropteroate synthase [Simiduia curdlanivorans]
MSKLVAFGQKSLDLNRPQIMGILNITPDSFSDGGRFFAGELDLDKVLQVAEQMLADGANMLDIGGESTRPGAESVGVQQEMDRVLPVVQAIATRFDTVISVDTSTASVMTAAAAAGAGLINDVRALQRPGALEAAAATGLPVCLMHMRGEPKVMQHGPQYGDVVSDVRAFLAQRIQACTAAGIARDQLILDPGFGFGKTLAHNIDLFRALPEFAKDSLVLVGVSRKSMVGDICQRGIEQRLPGSLALALLAAQSGASILRVHDVAETADVLRVLDAVRSH